MVKNKISLSILVAFMFCLNLLSVYAVGYYDLDNAWQIDKQDYMQEYISYDFEFVGNNTFILHWEVNDSFVYDVLEYCIANDDDDCTNDKVEEYKNKGQGIRNYNKNTKDIFGKQKKYGISDFKKEYFKDKKNKIKDDATRLYDDREFPTVTNCEVDIIGKINPFREKSGNLKLYMPHGILNYDGCYLQVGYSTLLTTLKIGATGYSAANLYFKYNESQKLWISLPKLSTLNDAKIDMKGYTDAASVQKYMGIETPSSIIGNYPAMEKAMFGHKFPSNLTSCGVASQGYTDQSNVYDGDWSTYYKYDRSEGAGLGFSRIIYPKPTNMTKAVFNYKYQIGSGSTVTNSIQLPNNCLNSSIRPNTLTTIWIMQYRYLSNNYEMFIYCDNGTTNTTLFTYPENWDSISFYEENMTYYIQKYTENPHLEVGEKGTPYEWNVTGNYTSSTANTTGNFSTEIETALADGECNCTECSGSGNDCLVPIYFYSERGGRITFSNVNISYNQTDAILNVFLYDAKTLTLLTNTNITVQTIGSQILNQGTTLNGTTFFSTTFENGTTSEDVTVRAYGTAGTNATDYTVVNQYITVVQGVNQNLSVYLTNTSDLTTTKYVTYHVENIQREFIENAVVQVLKQNPSTNQYINIIDLKTNPNGEATTILECDNTYYKYLVDYKGVRVYTSAVETPISCDSDTDNDIYFTINTDVEFTDFYDTVVNANVDLDFVDNGSFDSSDFPLAGYFQATFSSTSTVQACLYIYELNGVNATLNSSVCNTSTSATFNSINLNPANATTYRAVLYINELDGRGAIGVRVLTQVIGSSDVASAFKQEGRLFIFASILIGALAFIESPVVGILLMMFGFILAFATKVTPMSPTAISLMVGILVIALISVMRRRE